MNDLMNVAMKIATLTNKHAELKQQMNTVESEIATHSYELNAIAKRDKREAVKENTNQTVENAEFDPYPVAPCRALKDAGSALEAAT